MSAPAYEHADSPGHRPDGSRPHGLGHTDRWRSRQGGLEVEGPLRREPHRKRQRRQFSEPVVLPVVERWPRHLLPGCDDEPDLTLTIGTDDAYRVGRGELDPSVAFMQGKLKSTGDNALLLSILDWSATPAFTKALEDWAAAPPA